MSTEEQSFFDLLEKVKDYGSIKSQDFIAYCLPLVEELNLLHERQLCGHIVHIDRIKFNGSNLILTGEPKPYLISPNKLFIKPKETGVLQVTDNVEEFTDLDKNHVEVKSLSIEKNSEGATEPASLDKPKYLLNYSCWEHEKEHYDPLTDIFQLGQLFISLAFNLDLREKDDLEVFQANRKSLYFLNKHLHPTILNVLFEMTSLYREDRTSNLQEVITKFKNYRAYNPEHYVDLTETEGFRNQDVSKRNHWILSKLKNRLFDTSRRNKLLYFKERQSFLNLTISSVPLLLDHKNVRENDLIFWSNTIKKNIVDKQKLVLNSFLEFNENRFLTPTLNKIRLEARKSKNEYGFSQLRTVIAFLHWYNFKEDREEKITSPLLLLPTDIVKKKGVKDQYVLHFPNTEAEINPILSNYLKDLYDISLPDYIDLDNTSVDELVQSIQAQIAKGGTGINLEWRKNPSIQLVHSIAKKSFNLRAKKLHKKTKGIHLKSFDYSYKKEEFQPLGLQIFEKVIKSKNNALEYIINEDLNPKKNSAVKEKVRTFYSHDNDGEINPMIWEVDTCNMTLGNFNYRKMSLVRDYNEIINVDIKDKIFEQLFSEFPKRLGVNTLESSDLKSNYPIIAADPTQSAAIELARTGESYIIQGPPGTGKSQTITNLIADYIARDKKVLFVCEKRAALDVVFHRLKNKDLDELCCLIHDSQSDKKAFITNLKETYESFIKDEFNSIEIENKRDQIIGTIKSHLEKLNYFHSNMKKGDIAPLELFEVLHSTGKNRKKPDEIDMISFPYYKEWKENRNWIIDWFKALKTNNLGRFILDYPLAQLSENLIHEAKPKAIVHKKAKRCIGLLDDFNELIDNLDIENTENFLLQDWIKRYELIQKVKPFFSRDKLQVLVKNSSDAMSLSQAKEDIESAQNKTIDLGKVNSYWISKLSKEETKIAVNQWNRLSKSIFRYINPTYYKLKSQISGIYNFDAHVIKPEVSHILNNLAEEYTAQETILNYIDDLKSNFGLGEHWEKDYAWILEQQEKTDSILQTLIADKEGLKLLSNFDENFSSLVTDATLLFGDISKISLQKLEEKLAKSESNLNSLSAFLPFIEKGHTLSSEMQACLFSKSWDIIDFEYNLAYKSLNSIYEKERQFSEMDEGELRISISTINALLSKYYESNVDAIRSKLRAKFLDKIRITESVAAQLTSDEKVSKKTYNAARRILENEFGKSMRYKSIRELASSEANSLMTVLKPVWLMSPLSVSDTMPIDPEVFDVVIFDEASQITVEEGVPSLFRTHQTIVVGDEMQMPPTNFFSTLTSVDEEEEEIESKIGISLDADSLLNQGARKLSSVMLGWHYRSRHESLISFSNAAFYKRSLLTIPDNVILQSSIEPIAPILDTNDPVEIDSILNRSISFCYLENAIYDKRKNRDEADYIAKLVRDLLKGDSKLSIGVVAFSMDQQSEIELALERLSQEDSEFDTLLEQEYQRMDEDQFNGLFVKNLENVQGDERDIIIMSVCYGTNPKGKMLMNFGPINRRGGEKRLNVIFSRAKKKMVIVTSILPHEIKNDYNEGANYFKKFLAYAKYISDGELEGSNRVLDSLSSHEDQEKDINTNPVIEQLSSALIKKGYEVNLSIGQSYFKCDIAVKKTKDSGEIEKQDKYVLGILIDKKTHYENDNILEQYCQKPHILNAFGWKTYTVYSKDWFEKPERVLEKIEQTIRGEEERSDLNLDDLITSEEKNDVLENIQDNTKQKESHADNNLDVSSREEDEPYERYEFSSKTSNKYWEIRVDGNSIEVRYGRIGNKPRSIIKEFPDEETAHKEKKRMAYKKVIKGYVKV